MFGIFFDMSFKEEIGQRIAKARKDKQLTIKALSELTKTLSIPRISNWEQGIRSPGPVEALQLAEHLDISASYLLGLTPNPSGDLSSSLATAPFVPFQEIEQFINDSNSHESLKEIIVQSLNEESYQHAELVATRLIDDSMNPEFQKNDLVIVDCHKHPTPGQYVLVYLQDKSQVVFRKYSENNKNEALFELLATNSLWPAITIRGKADAKIIGTLVELRKSYV